MYTAANFDRRMENSFNDLKAGRTSQPLRTLDGVLVTPEMLGVTPPQNRKSKRAELVAWCNRLAQTAGVLNDDPKRGPVYFCTEENFGRR